MKLRNENGYIRVEQSIVPVYMWGTPREIPRFICWRSFDDVFYFSNNYIGSKSREVRLAPEKMCDEAKENYN